MTVNEREREEEEETVNETEREVVGIHQERGIVIEAGCKRTEIGSRDRMASNSHFKAT